MRYAIERCARPLPLLLALSGCGAGPSVASDAAADDTFDAATFDLHFITDAAVPADQRLPDSHDAYLDDLLAVPDLAILDLAMADLAPTSDLTAGPDLIPSPVDMASPIGPCGDIRGLQAGAAWPMFGHCPTHIGRSPTVGAQAAALKWTFAAGGYIHSSPAVAADGTIYFGSADHKVYAVHPDGKLRWTYSTGNAISTTPAIAADGTVYIGSEDKNLYALNPDGTLKWVFTTGGSIDSSPTIGGDGTVYVGSFDDYLHAILPNGKEKWKFPTGQGVYTSPAIDLDGRIYVGSGDGTFYYGIGADGSDHGHLSSAASIDCAPAIGDNGAIYVGWHGDLVCTVPPGKAAWVFDPLLKSAFVATPALAADRTIYAASRKLFALNVDGTIRWSYTAGNGEYYASPSVGGDGTIYVGSTDKSLRAIRPNGTLLWSYQCGGVVEEAPVIGGDGTIYAGAGDGKLYAIGK